ncbi:hypothetical protein GGX14DRAFT_607454 [Mycena pura]|uniref:Uncharacterized protein n=1 Tax=Mycena pura TaxID=153505 RepID=A0AAD6Y1B3_9AGAR|nr:hypothetical protein GGX14DRAFT_607454 [Mycena pura]
MLPLAPAQTTSPGVLRQPSRERPFSNSAPSTVYSPSASSCASSSSSLTSAPSRLSTSVTSLSAELSNRGHACPEEASEACTLASASDDGHHMAHADAMGPTSLVQDLEAFKRRLAEATHMAQRPSASLSMADVRVRSPCPPADPDPDPDAARPSTIPRFRRPRLGVRRALSASSDSRSASVSGDVDGSRSRSRPRVGMSMSMMHIFDVLLPAPTVRMHLARGSAPAARRRLKRDDAVMPPPRRHASSPPAGTDADPASTPMSAEPGAEPTPAWTSARSSTSTACDPDPCLVEPALRTPGTFDPERQSLNSSLRRVASSASTASACSSASSIVFATPATRGHQRAVDLDPTPSDFDSAENPIYRLQATTADQARHVHDAEPDVCPPRTRSRADSQSSAASSMDLIFAAPAERRHQRVVDPDAAPVESLDNPIYRLQATTVAHSRANKLARTLGTAPAGDGRAPPQDAPPPAAAQRTRALKRASISLASFLPLRPASPPPASPPQAWRPRPVRKSSLSSIASLMQLARGAPEAPPLRRARPRSLSCPPEPCLDAEPGDTDTDTDAEGPTPAPAPRAARRSSVAFAFAGAGADAASGARHRLGSEDDDEDGEYVRVPARAEAETETPTRAHISKHIFTQ